MQIPLGIATPFWHFEILWALHPWRDQSWHVLLMIPKFAGGGSSNNKKTMSIIHTEDVAHTVSAPPFTAGPLRGVFVNVGRSALCLKALKTRTATVHPYLSVLGESSNICKHIPATISRFEHIQDHEHIPPCAELHFQCCVSMRSKGSPSEDLHATIGCLPHLFPNQGMV